MNSKSEYGSINMGTLRRSSRLKRKQTDSKEEKKVEKKQKEE